MQEARLRTHKRLPVQLLDPADGSFGLRRQFDEWRIAAGRRCNANIMVPLVGPLRQVGLGGTWVTAWRLLVQHLEGIGEAFGQFVFRALGNFLVVYCFSRTDDPSGHHSHLLHELVPGSIPQG